MPISLTVLLVTDDNGALKQFHIAEVCGEGCNLDAARAAEHVHPSSWQVLMETVRTQDWPLKEFLCDRAFGLTVAG